MVQALLVQANEAAAHLSEQPWDVHSELVAVSVLEEAHDVGEAGVEGVQDVDPRGQRSDRPPGEQELRAIKGHAAGVQIKRVQDLRRGVQQMR